MIEAEYLNDSLEHDKYVKQMKKYRLRIGRMSIDDAKKISKESLIRIGVIDNE